MLANFLSGLRVLLIPLLFHFIAQGEAAPRRPTPDPKRETHPNTPQAQRV